MGSIKGKLEVDLYANPDPMIQGFMKGESAAKKYGGSIGDSIENMNKKQMKSAAHGLLGGLTTIGLAESGARIALELVNGFKAGSIKSFGDAAALVGNTIEKGLKAIPIAGTFLEIGEAIGNMIFGIDAANKSLQETNAQMERSTNYVKQMKADQVDTMAKLAAVTKANIDFGKNANQIAVEAFIKGEKEKVDALAVTKKAMDATDAKNRAAETKDQITSGSLGSVATGYMGSPDIVTQVPKYTPEENIANQERILRLAKEIQKAEYETIAIHAEEMAKQLAQNSELRANEVAKQTILNDQIAAQAEVDNLQKQAAQIGLTERELQIEKLIAMKGMSAEQYDLALAAWDTVAAAKEHQKILADMPAALAKAADAYDKQMEAQQALDTAKDDRSASATSVSTALGSIKMEGVTDFSKSKEIENAQKALTKATETAASTKGSYDQLVKLNQSLGG